MPDWRALLRLKRKRSRTSHSPKATPQPIQPAQAPVSESPQTPTSESAPVASTSTTSANQHQSSPKRPTYGTSKTADKISSSVTNGLKLSLHLLKEAVTGIGVPELEAAVSGVVKVIDIIDNVRDNDRDLESLSSRISGVATAVSKSPSLHPRDKVPEGLRLRMETFLKELQVFLDEVEDILSDRHIALRAANSEANRDAITEINAGIDQLISQFTAQIIQEYEASIEKIPRVHVRYNDTSTKPSRPCHQGTRTELLQGINNWIEGGGDDTPYLWLCGEVGVGKTTVAHTIAKEQEGLKQLGASFFFSRHDSGRQAPPLLFPSLAYQLARFDRGIWRALAEILKPDPDIVNRELTEQFMRLILQPLSRSGMPPSRTVVIVIDGLDECTDPTSVLDALALGVKEVKVGLRILVCSRPHAANKAKFKNTRLFHLATQNHFHDINPETLSKDVAAFLTWTLREISSRPANRDLPSPWPAEHQLAELIARASGLFIIASTYAKYVDDPTEDNPAGQLNRILSRKRGIGSSPLAELDALYDQVLDDLRRSLKTAQELTMARDVIETVILAQSETNLGTFSGLLSMEPSDVRSFLRRLTAVILLPEDQAAAITPFHASFGEYMQDEARCTIRELSVDTTSVHDRIAARCITTMASAARNGVIGVEYPTSTSMPTHLKYASRNLTLHLSSSSHNQTVQDKETTMECCIWTWLNLLLVVGNPLTTIQSELQKSGFQRLLKAEGRDAYAATGTSVGRLMIANHVRALNRKSEMSLELATSSTESAASRQSKGIQVIKFTSDDVENSAYGTVRYVLDVIADARRWNVHNHPNMFVRGVKVDLNFPREVLLLVSSTSSLRGICSLSKYLRRVDNSDIVSRIRLALEIVEYVRHLHKTSPLHAHGWLVPDIILVSAKGKPVFAPRTWFMTESSADLDNSDSFDCRMKRSSDWGSGDHWSTPETIDYRSPSARQSEDVWDIGSILFLMMTTSQHLPCYKQLATDVPDRYWTASSVEAREHQARFERAVALLLDDITGFEEVKATLKACWAFKPRDRPSAGEVAEQLEAIVRKSYGYRK